MLLDSKYFTAPDSVLSMTINSISSSTLTLSWIGSSISQGLITHYMVFYLPIRGPYGPIFTDDQSQGRNKEFSLNTTTTTATLTSLNGSVTYRIQVSAVALYSNGLELIGMRSTAVMVTTAEGGTYCTVGIIKSK